MRLYVFTLQLHRDELLKKDNLYMLVAAKSWKDMEKQTRLGMWLDDDVLARGEQLGHQDKDSQYPRGLEDIEKDIKHQGWFPLPNHGLAQIKSYKVDGAFLGKLREVGLLKKEEK